MVGQIDGQTKLMGVIGENIQYTLSPRLHNAAAKALRINALYLPFSMAGTSLENFLKAMWDVGALGFSVTTPHKQAVARMTGSSLGSVNTLYRAPGGWGAASTDGPGFVRGLARIGVVAEDLDRVVFLGSGGATVGLIEHLATMPKGPKRFAVLRRSERADAEINRVAGLCSVRFASLQIQNLSTELAGAGRDTLLIQASSAPHHGDDLAYLVPALKNFGGAVAELAYGKQSMLLGAAQQQGLPFQNGLPMLIEQARLAQELWWGKALSYDAMVHALESE